MGKNKNIQSYMIGLFTIIDEIEMECINCNKNINCLKNKDKLNIKDILKKQYYIFLDKGITFEETICDNCGCNTFNISVKINVTGMNKGESNERN